MSLEKQKLHLDEISETLYCGPTTDKVVRDAPGDKPGTLPRYTEGAEVIRKEG